MISNMPCYAEMKDSGVEWLGEIPVGWDISRMNLMSLYLLKMDFGAVM
jgi:hypothetical protein